MANGSFNAGFAEIKRVYAPPGRGKGSRMASRTTPCVKEPAWCLKHINGDEPLNQIKRFVLAAMSVEQVVGLGVEPRLEPLGVRFPQVRFQF